MTNEKKLNVGLFILMLCGLALIMKIQTRKSDRSSENFFIKYPFLLLMDSLDGHVTDVAITPGYMREGPDYTFVEINDSIKLTISVIGQGPISLDSALKVGVHVFKKSLSDTLIIYEMSREDTLKHTFKINTQTFEERRE